MYPVKGEERGPPSLTSSVLFSDHRNSHCVSNTAGGSRSCSQPAPSNNRHSGRTASKLSIIYDKGWRNFARPGRQIVEEELRCVTLRGYSSHTSHSGPQGRRSPPRHPVRYSLTSLCMLVSLLSAIVTMLPSYYLS